MNRTSPDSVEAAPAPAGQDGRRPRRLWSRFYRSLSPHGTERDRRNALYLYIEMFWAHAQVAVGQFNAPFALRLGATNAEIGLLSSIPALIALLVTVPAGRLFSRQTHRRAWLGSTIFAYRLGFLMAAFVPWLATARPGSTLVWLLIAFTLPSYLFSAGWNATLADVISEKQRARVFGVRNTLAHISLTISILGFGLWLDTHAFPGNYQAIYIVAFAASLVSAFFITKVTPPAGYAPAPRPATPAPATPRALWRGIRTATKEHPDFVRITVNTFCHGVGLWMVAPVYVLYYVRQLGATEGWISLNILAANLSPILGYMLWQRIVERRGENRALKWAMTVIGFYPLLVGLTPALAIIPILTALNGMVAAGVNLSHFNMLLKVSPDGERANYLAVYTTVCNAGAFIMPLVGVWLVSLFGYAPVLIAGGVLCILGSNTFRWNPLRAPDSLGLSGRP